MPQLRSTVVPTSFVTRVARGASVMAVALCTVLASPHAAAATEWFVASGAAGDGSAAAPFGSIQAALEAAQPGDIVSVAPGMYAEGLSSVRGGVAGAPIIVRAADGPGSAIVSRSGRLLTVSHPFVIVDGLVFDGQYAPTDIVKLSSGANHFVLRNAEVRRSGRDCIDMNGPADVTIERTSIHHCLWWNGARQDAHAIAAGPVQRLTLRELDVHTFSGDGLQLDPGRSLPGWNDVVVERSTFRLAPLSATENGFPAGLVPGENAVDTKTNPEAPRARLTITDTVAEGFGPGLIANMAAFNLKENVEVTVDRVTVSLSEIAFRVRGPGARGGARVDIRNAVIHHVVTGVRYEDDIEKIAVAHTTFGRNITRPFEAASSGDTGLDVRDSLFLAATLPGVASAAAGNMAGEASWFVDVAADDYRLRGGTPAIDAAKTPGTPATDRLGVRRPQGGGADVGAFEWTAATPPRRR
jgi:hypothetical protein